MRFTRLKLKNWRNFTSVDVALRQRVFLVGPNASGKSNLLDALKFLRDVADPSGGIQRALRERQGVSAIRALHARRWPSIGIEVEADLEDGEAWTYALEFTQDKQRKLVITRENVSHGRRVILNRPNISDRRDAARLSQTHLEQVNANKDFRALAEFFSRLRYLHIVPQLVRDPDRSVGRSNDPYGGDFLEQVARTPSHTAQSRLKRIERAMRIAVPQMQQLRLSRDERGVPHLEGLYEHWRKGAGWQNERQWSDGTLRLLGLLWAFLDGSAPLLLEEPELSLHSAVVRHLPGVLAQLGRRTGRQIMLSTHSADLLGDPGIDATEILLLIPGKEGTEVKVAADLRDVSALLKEGIPASQAVLPRTAPPDAKQLSLFGAEA